MMINLTLLVVAGVVLSVGVYLLLERAMTRMIMGFMLISNATALLLLLSGGFGSPPIMFRENILTDNQADPLAHGMILTAIVITMGLTAFLLTLAYRQYQINTADQIEDDVEDAMIASRSVDDPSVAPDHDASDDPMTGRPTAAGDNFGPESFEAPLIEVDDLRTQDGPDTTAAKGGV